MPGKKALLVISNGKAVKENGSLVRTLEELRLSGVESILYENVGANPLKEAVEAGAQLASASGCDFVVGLGGGSVLDAAKVMAMLATNGGDLWDYAVGGSGKGIQPKNPALPMIAITTTAGTGSEVDQWGVVTKGDTHEKIGIGGYDSMFPVLAVVDPELMMTVPPNFTAYQGFDALFHSVEVYISKAANPMSDMIALTAIEAVGKHLARAVKDGSDTQAREAMAFANTMSGLAMVIGVTTSQHSLEHALSAYHQDLPHGAGLIMISKGYFPFFISKRVCDERFVKMAQLLGNPKANKPEDFAVELDKLKAECQVASLKMSDYGVLPQELPLIAKNARATMGGLFAVDRYQLTDDDATTILNASYA
jgi:alcohol dehydrogenase